MHHDIKTNGEKEERDKYLLEGVKTLAHALWRVRRWVLAEFAR